MTDTGNTVTRTGTERSDLRGPAGDVSVSIGAASGGAIPAATGLIGITLCAALIAISLGYTFFYDFECRAVFPVVLCQSLSLGVPRALCAAALAGLVVCVRPDIRQHFAAALRRRFAPGPYALFVLGMLGILTPLGYAMLTSRLLTPPAMLGLWSGGLAMAATGLLLCALHPQRIGGAPPHRTLWPIAAALVVGALLPDLVLVFQHAWAIEELANATFWSVGQLLQILGQEVQTVPAEKILRIDDFAVAVGRSCSGVEGFALITVFTVAYLLLFRRDLILARAIWLLPVALGLSWCLNVLRIATLTMIGRYVSPDLAANGFHSHAGWIAFLALAMLIAAAAHRLRWFRRLPKTAAAARPRSRFFADPVVVLILPFVVFMASSTLLSAVVMTPALLYPLRILAVVLVFMLGRAVLRQRDWQIDPVPVGAGIACGVLWLLTAPPATAQDTALIAALAGLPSGLLIGWIVMRVFGTAVVVPLLEEFFFRGYLQTRISRISGPLRPVWPWLGVLMPALCFGALHERVVAGVLAGLLFGLLYWRHDRLADAVYAHGAANAVIAAAALRDGAWHLI